MRTKMTRKPHQLVGWCEHVSLPQLGLSHIQAKIDTGARTSALHAFRVDTFEQDGVKKVSFDIHPHVESDEIVTCVADLHDCRVVTDSGGHSEERLVIKTMLSMGEESWPIEVTLTNRDNMSFRMLLGRTALHHRMYVDPARKFLLPKNLKLKSMVKVKGNNL